VPERGTKNKFREEVESRGRYQSPRWSNEFLDCSMPMTFDQYNMCSYRCLYCFSYYQRSHNKDYVANNIRAADVEKVKHIFTHPDESQFGEYVKKRIPMQWGGLSEPFDLQEQKLGIGLELMRFFREIDYPISFSTKSVWMHKDDRYREVLRGAKNFHFKVSIITLDEERAKKMEIGVPTPEERFWGIGELVKLGVSAVNLRLRPFIIGLSDPYHKEMIKKAKDLGAYGLSTEFYCLESRANSELRKRYKDMSQLVGYDLWEFYRVHSKGSGYRRLNYEIKRPFVQEMEEECRKVGLNFFISDAHHKERCHHGSCCGLPQDEYFSNYAKCQFTEAIVLAKRNGEVRFSDLIENEHLFLEKVMYSNAEGLNTTNLKNMADNKFRTLYDKMRSEWNNPKRSNSPYQYFDKLLVPTGLDDRGDVIYKFNKEKHEGSDTQ
jgi:DNA repair photolyase